MEIQHFWGYYCSVGVILSYLNQCRTMEVNITVKVGVILIEQISEPFDLPRVGPALSIAFERIQEDFGIKFDPVYRNYSGICPWEAPLGILSELYYYDHIDALIGPACSQGVESSARLAQYLNLPMVSGLGDLALRTNPTDMFKTLTKLSYNVKKISGSMSMIMQAYDWQHAAILYDEEYILWKVIGENLAIDFRSTPFLERPYDISFYPSRMTAGKYANILLEAKAHARELFRTLMHEAYRLGMANGEFVFITLELFPSEWMGFYRQYLRDDGNDGAVGQAYESVLIVTLTQPDSHDPEFIVFAEEVKRRALVQYGYMFKDGEEVNYFITAFYDSALYLANIYNKTLHEGGNINDGMAIAQKFWNTSFPGITGTVFVDETGERVADFDLLDMTSADTQEFQMVGRYLGATHGYTESRDIVWPRGQPRDKPVCGFKGDECVKEDDLNVGVIVASTVTALTLVTLVVVFVAYRRVRQTLEIGRRLWVVDVDDIVIRKDKFGSTMLSKSTLSVISSIKNLYEMQTFTEVGHCRGQTVAIRRLAAQTLSITKRLELEFYEMHRLSHPNVAKFVGACVKPGTLRLLMEYCPRGSLQDILQNESIDLDWNFRYSLMYDIIKGMQHLHGSTIQIHGRLTSTNCVIDSRFMLKLTDYGLPSVFASERTEDKFVNGDLIYKKYLWTAPELLRKLSVNGSIIQESQTGDVYSFSIIMQEIVSRGEPFEASDLSPAEIVKKLVTEEFRPMASLDDCPPAVLTLMKQCWAEEPTQRPTFTAVEHQFRQIRAGKSMNIMDNLLERMSQYADNLEALAAERTQQYLDEKQRALQLLHRLLPPSVARQLEAGNSVTPELFQCVSLYFSDIVGFTSLAASSTPIEVVDLLNDLFTQFDQAVDSFNVYKVETIGDAYMVVSGLPERNGDAHIAEVAGMALAMMSTVAHFTVRHRSDEKLKIRAGIHSGSVVTGVVGKTMPRYCLFGDAVNTASRMESTSKPMRIQMTEESKLLLEHFPQYLTKERGLVDIKGKGTMKTYWLKGRKETSSSGDHTKDTLLEYEDSDTIIPRLD